VTRSLFAAAWILAAAACGSSPHPTRFYRVEPPDTAGGSVVEGPRSGARPTLVIRRVRVDEAYTDARIAYRRGEYELSYYHYHRWASPVSEQVADALQRGYEGTGRFERVLRDEDLDQALILETRVERFEEVDVEADRWVGHLVLRLQLEDALTGDVVWSARESERVPMPDQSPSGLAAALSRALQQVVERTAGEIAAAAPDRPGRAGSAQPAAP
jgi:ABC-type uncharacterized transport system auxiliary subunit